MLDRFLYNIVIRSYWLIIYLASPFNRKAKMWLEGRKDYKSSLSAFCEAQESIIWFHCASLGEFEQARALFDLIRFNHPNYKFVLSFFSPSGYEQTKNSFDDKVHVCYLPLDTQNNAKEFIAIVKPKLSVFTKNDFWYYYLGTLSESDFPFICISMNVQANSGLDSWKYKLVRRELNQAEALFIQRDSDRLNDLFNKEKSIIVGDNRMDRVLSLTNEGFDDDIISSFLQDEKAFIFGSIYIEDLPFVKAYNESNPNTKLIIVPHDVDAKNVVTFSSNLRRAELYSNYQGQDSNMIIIDQIGLLSKLYRFANGAYIGGGFNKGIHNILEPAVNNIPIFFGPKYEAFPEAIDLIELSIARNVNNTDEFVTAIKSYDNVELWEELERNCRNYFAKHAGASKKVYEYLLNKELL